METGRPYSRLLHRLERLSTLSGVDRQRIAELPLKLVNYPAGRDIVSHGYSPSRCTLVLDGYLCRHKPVSGSRRQITSFFVAGDIADLATLHLLLTAESVLSRSRRCSSRSPWPALHGGNATVRLAGEAERRDALRTVHGYALVCTR